MAKENGGAGVYYYSVVWMGLKLHVQQQFVMLSIVCNDNIHWVPYMLNPMLLGGKLLRILAKCSFKK